MAAATSVSTPTTELTVAAPSDATMQSDNALRALANQSLFPATRLPNHAPTHAPSAAPAAMLPNTTIPPGPWRSNPAGEPA